MEPASKSRAGTRTRRGSVVPPPSLECVAITLPSFVAFLPTTKVVHDSTEKIRDATAMAQDSGKDRILKTGMSLMSAVGNCRSPDLLLSQSGVFYIQSPDFAHARIFVGGLQTHSTNIGTPPITFRIVREITAVTTMAAFERDAATMRVIEELKRLYKVSRQLKSLFIAS